MIRTEDFDYHLPEELIAQVPLENRSESRLLVLNKKTKTIEHKHFYDIIDFLNENDVLVLNDTKVIPARLYGVKEDTKAVIEILLLKDLSNNLWETLARPQKKVKIGTRIIFSDELSAICVEKCAEGVCHFKLEYKGILMEILDRLGEMPLPPYIHEKLKEKDRYNTVYAKNLGSAAAPTAGLHFTPELLEKLYNKKIEIYYVTLHVGLGTFRPVSEEDASKHHMHSEYYEVKKEVADALNKAKKLNKRIIAVGTTTTRTLESNYDNGFKEEMRATDIFIYPGYKFKAIDALITNFHLPKSTLLMLISAFYGREDVLMAYEEAVKEKYRFFSFGDSMFIY